MKIKKISPKLQRIVSICFPSYKGRKWRAETREQKSCLSYWDGGSRDSFVVLDLATMKAFPVPETNPFSNNRPGPVQIRPGTVIVENSIFMGKPSGITFHVRPEDIAAFLEGSEIEQKL